MVHYVLCLLRSEAEIAGYTACLRCMLKMTTGYFIFSPFFSRCGSFSSEQLPYSSCKIFLQVKLASKITIFPPKIFELRPHLFICFWLVNGF